jgi:ElaA protein
MEIAVRAFDDLTLRELHDVLALRADVFVVEQDCPYLDPDGEDPAAIHVLGTENGSLVGYARIHETPEGARIGRVVTARDVRGRGLGHDLVRASVAAIGERASYLHAQDHLRAFYAAHGFRPAGDVFDEDGIPHVRMDRPSDPQA